ncbi:MarR family transcriptional regulator [Nocardia terpenica]|nr:MarR family transcriptional regulator [Nocardia terpenica]MBF6103255.1 MarR family transcriptional regulator [Nocardia terpenica]MBF6110556.1 MarR family transcriptional regulator [Nocardia terpenica]MBF6116687.1 MarR family transcriptional regulator [Nocardia terpenica]
MNITLQKAFSKAIWRATRLSRVTRETDRADELIAAWQAELPEILGPSSELSKRIMLLAGALGVATRSVLPEFGLTEAEYDVLVTLRRIGAPYRLKANDLARALVLSTGGTSNVVNRLESAGLVRRENHPSDGRSTLIGLTAEGIDLAERAVRAGSAAHDAVFAEVPAEVLRAATEALRAVGDPATARSAPRPGRVKRGGVSA